MPIAATSRPRRARLRERVRAPRAAACRQISSASCSTQPGFGKCCVNSMLIDGGDRAVAIEEDRARRGRALIERHHVAAHATSSAARGLTRREERVDELVGREVAQVLDRPRRRRRSAPGSRTRRRGPRSRRPCAVPSSLVSTRPVTRRDLGEERAPGRSRSGRCWRRARAASRAARPGDRGRSRARSCASSSISGFFVCRRPAVSMIATSAPRADAGLHRVERDRRRDRRPAGPRSPRSRRARPTTWSCSIAAARKVSPAPSTTL